MSDQRRLEVSSAERRRAVPVVQRIISGGQTGVDRGALEAAIALGLEHGGWCPRGRRAEDGRVPERYRLQEADSARYDVRTEYNVAESDATLIIHRGQMSAGTALTRKLAQRRGKPLTLIDLTQRIDEEQIRDWLARVGVRTLNVAGPRESSSPGIERASELLLIRLLTPLASDAAASADAK